MPKTLSPAFVAAYSAIKNDQNLRRAALSIAEAALRQEGVTVVNMPLVEQALQAKLEANEKLKVDLE